MIAMDHDKLDRIERLRRAKRRMSLVTEVKDPGAWAERFTKMSQEFRELNCLVNADECVARASYWAKVALGDQGPEETPGPDQPEFERRNWTDI